MNEPRILPAVLASALLAGCAGDRQSYWRWYRYMEGPSPYSDWAHCVRHRSAHYLNPEDPPVAGNHSQLFSHVLADCRQFMTGPAWNDLSDVQRRQLVEDAYRDFYGTHADIMAQREASII